VAIKCRVEQEQEEILVVIKPNAIVNPWAVMVHLENAHSADPTVVATVWLILMAPLAVTPIPSSLLFQRIEGFWCLLTTVIDPFWAIWDTSRVHGYAPHVTQDKKQSDTVKNYPLPQTTEL